MESSDERSALTVLNQVAVLFERDPVFVCDVISTSGLHRFFQLARIN